MKTLFTTFLFLVAVLLTGCMSYSPKDAEFTGGSFNILGGDKKSNTTKQRSALAKKLIEYHFDIVGVQEASRAQTEAIMPKGYGISGVNIRGIKLTDIDPNEPFWSSWGNYIIYKKDRFEIYDEGYFWLSPTPEKDSKGWDEKQYRVCNWAKFIDKTTGKKFVWFNTHFGLTKNSRLESAHLMVKKIGEIANGLPFFASGDYNTSPLETPTLDALKEGGLLHNSREISITEPYGPDATFTGAMLDNFYREKDKKAIGTFGKTRKNSLIDYIWVSKGTTILNWAALSDHVNLKFPSDHLPIKITARIK